MLDEPRAGALGGARVEIENAGTATWHGDVSCSVPLARRARQPDRLDGIRTPLPREVAPDERVTLRVAVRAPIPPATYRFALDLVAEHRAWFGGPGRPGGGQSGHASRRSGSRTWPTCTCRTDGSWPRDRRRSLYRRTPRAMPWWRRRSRRAQAAPCARALERTGGRRSGLRPAAPLPLRPARHHAPATRRRRGAACVRAAARRAVDPTAASLFDRLAEPPRDTVLQSCFGSDSDPHLFGQARDMSSSASRPGRAAGRSRSATRRRSAADRRDRRRLRSQRSSGLTQPSYQRVRLLVRELRSARAEPGVGEESPSETSRPRRSSSISPITRARPCNTVLQGRKRCRVRSGRARRSADPPARTARRARDPR